MALQVFQLTASVLLSVSSGTLNNNYLPPNSGNSGVTNRQILASFLRSLETPLLDNQRYGYEPKAVVNDSKLLIL